MSATPEDLVRAHNQGQADESNDIPIFIRSWNQPIGSSEEEKEAYRQGEESVRQQRNNK